MRVWIYPKDPSSSTAMVLLKLFFAHFLTIIYNYFSLIPLNKPLLCVEGVPGLPGAPQDEAGVMRKFEMSHVVGATCRMTPISRCALEMNPKPGPERSCTAAVIHSQVVPRYCVEPSVSQARIFSSSVNLW